MSSWQAQLKATIGPVVRRSKTVDAIVVGSGVLDQVAPLLAACFIRRCYTLFDLLNDLGLLDPAVDSCFGPDGVWP